MGTLKLGVHRSAGRRNLPFHECVYSWGSSARPANPCGPVGKVVGAGTVFAGLMMLQALAAHRIAERKKEIVVIVVMGVEKLLRLHHQVLVVLQLFRRDLKLVGLVGEDIEVHLVVGARGQVHALVVDAGIERRVDQAYSA